MQSQRVFYSTRCSARLGRAADSTLQKDIPCHFLLCSVTKARGELAVGSSITQGLSGHQSSCGGKLFCLSIGHFFFFSLFPFSFLLFPFPFSSFVLSFSFLLNSIHLHPWRGA